MLLAPNHLATRSQFVGIDVRPQPAQIRRMYGIERDVAVEVALPETLLNFAPQPSEFSCAGQDTVVVEDQDELSIAEEDPARLFFDKSAFVAGETTRQNDAA